MEKNENNKLVQNSHGTNIPLDNLITAEGSLGLLALGAVGVKAWKKKKAEVLAAQTKNIQK